MRRDASVYDCSYNIHGERIKQTNPSEPSNVDRRRSKLDVVDGNRGDMRRPDCRLSSWLSTFVVYRAALDTIDKRLGDSSRRPSGDCA